MAGHAGPSDWRCVQANVFLHGEPRKARKEGTDMDLLKAVAITFPCDVCGGRRAVTLEQMLMSQDILGHEGCLAPQGERECPPATFAPLVDHELLIGLQDLWGKLTERAHAVGGQLSVCDTPVLQKP